MNFAALEIMGRQRATLAKKEMEFVEAQYWLAEAEEWKQLKERTCLARSHRSRAIGPTAQ
jgi:hypothetical protein